MEKFNYTVAENIESVRKRQPEPILLGAIISQGNNLHTDKGRFYDLIRTMQSGDFQYPESVKPIVDSVTFNESGQYPESEQIESMYARLSVTKKIDFNNNELGNSCLQMSDAIIYDFLEKYADDYEALEFFDRCGEYLSVPERL